METSVGGVKEECWIYRPFCYWDRCVIINRKWHTKSFFLVLVVLCFADWRRPFSQIGQETLDDNGYWTMLFGTACPASSSTLWRHDGVVKRWQTQQSWSPSWSLVFRWNHLGTLSWQVSDSETLYHCYRAINNSVQTRTSAVRLHSAVYLAPTSSGLDCSSSKCPSSSSFNGHCSGTVQKLGTIIADPGHYRQLRFCTLVYLGFL